MFQLLLEKDVDVNVRDLEGMTPSMWACRMDHIEHFSLLSELEAQPGPDTDGFDRDCNGRTWLHWSVRRTEPLECLRVSGQGGQGRGWIQGGWRVDGGWTQ